MKKTKILTLVASAALVNWVAAESPPTYKTRTPEKPSEEKKGVFGEWLIKKASSLTVQKSRTGLIPMVIVSMTGCKRVLAHLSVKTVQTKKSFDQIKPEQEGEKPETAGPDPRPFLPSPNLKRVVRSLSLNLALSQVREAKNLLLAGLTHVLTYLSLNQEKAVIKNLTRIYLGHGSIKMVTSLMVPKSRIGSTLMGITLTTVNRKFWFACRVKIVLKKAETTSASPKAKAC